MLTKLLSLFVLLSVATLVGCGPPDGYSVRVVDPSGKSLPITKRNGVMVVTGQVGQTYGIEITNQTNGPVGVVVSVDGLDVQRSGTADLTMDGLRQRGASIMEAYTHFTLRGFDVSASKISTFRFAAPNDALASVIGSSATIGQIEVDFLATVPRPTPQAAPVPDPEPAEESDTGYVKSPASEAPRGTVGEVIADEKSGTPSAFMMDRDAKAPLLRLIILYEAPKGEKVGTAGPPPSKSAPIARPDVGLATDPALEAEPPKGQPSGVKPTKPTKTAKGIDVPKPTKEAPKPTKEAPKEAPKPTKESAKPEKSTK